MTAKHSRSGSRRTSTRPSEALLGAHLSIAGGLHNALLAAKRLRCTAVQIFTKNASTWKERNLSDRESARFIEHRNAARIQVVLAHTAYLINLASDKPDVRARSQAALENEMIRCDCLEIPYLVLHPGAHMGQGEAAGLALVAAGIRRAFSRLPENRTRVLLETCAGQGTGLGHRFEHFARIIDAVGDRERVGVCLDTCHMFAAGYDFRTASAYHHTFDTFDAVVGLDFLYAIHLNDSKKTLGARVDRHEHIGKGTIGIDAFRLIMNDPRLVAIPKIIETPRRRGADINDDVNLKVLRSLLVQ